MRFTLRSRHRQLTFIGEDDVYEREGDEPLLGLVVGFAVMAVSFFLMAWTTIRITRQTRQLYEWNAIRLILPSSMIFLGLESLTLAFDVASFDIMKQWAIAIYMLESTCAPGIFMATFATTFLAYRTRSIPFCLVYRGPGRSNTNAGLTTDDEERSTLIRPATMVVLMRLFTLGIMVLSVVVNFDVVWETPNLAGRTGWMTLILGDYQEAADHIVYSLIPMGLVSFSCLYFSFLLWRYGSEFSMIVYPSIVNPWIYTFLGVLFMIAGQFPGPQLFPVLSNAGILIYLASLLRVLFEVRQDMLQAGDLGQFLNALGQDHISNAVTETGSTINKGTVPDTEEGPTRPTIA
jgi:hypothetical protein